MSYLVSSPFPIFEDVDGQPLENGMIYIGTANLNPEANPVAVFWDAALTQPAAQPIRTSGGYPARSGTPARVYTSVNYSIMVKDSRGQLVFSELSAGAISRASSISATTISDFDFDPTILSMDVNEVRTLITTASPANTPPGINGTYSLVTLYKITSSEYRVSVSQTGTMGDTLNRAYAAGVWGIWYKSTGDYDLIVDSNATLDLWVSHVGGLFKRVLIREGTWAATALGATGGVLLDLDTSGTKYVFAEKGAMLVFSGGFAGTMYGMYHASVATDLTLETFYGVNITLTNTTATRSATAFYKLTNLTNCSGIGTGSTSGAGKGFDSCNRLLRCTGTGSSGTTGGGTGIDTCDQVGECTGTGSGGSAGGSGTGLANCTKVINCTGTGSATAAGGSGIGFFNCSQVEGCTGTGTHGSSGIASGFTNCNQISSCSGSGTTVSGTAMGISGCTKVSNCTGTGTGGSTGVGFGLDTCTQVTNCTGTAIGGTVSGRAVGIRTCVQVTMSRGVGTAAGAGTGHGFADACVNLQQNRPNGSSKTATYDATCFAGSAANAPADTAAGGYNLP